MNDALLPAPRTYLDSNIFIYLIERSTRWHDLALKVFVDADRSGTRLFTSDLTVAECLLQPHRHRNAPLISRYERFFEQDAEIARVAVDYGLLKYASHIGGALGMKLSDAIHVASALSVGCEMFVTNDHGIRAPDGLAITRLGDS